MIPPKRFQNSLGAYFALKKTYFPWFYDKTNPKIGLYVKNRLDISPPIIISTLYIAKLDPV